MILEDLQHIFKTQVEEGTVNLYYMLEDRSQATDGDPAKRTVTVMRHPVDAIADLLPMLDSFQYNGTHSRMPRFVK